jgi:metallo-beta-lactamase class B
MVGRSLSVRSGVGGVAVCAFLIVAGCQSKPAASRPESIEIAPGVSLQPIADGVWVYTTYFDLPGFGPCPANGLLVIDKKEAMLIDLPWTDEQTGVLCDWAAKNHQAELKVAVPTHFHQDCMGGLAEAHRRGATSYALDKTIKIAREKGLPVPKIPYQLRTMVHCGSTVALLTYEGPGHTTDNVVAWMPKQGILFGGCLIKSMDAQSLGNTADGDLVAYPATLREVQREYARAKIVVPGHGDWGGPELIEHTLKLCQPVEPKH